jgi:hypothetical protein
MARGEISGWLLGVCKPSLPSSLKLLGVSSSIGFLHLWFFVGVSTVASLVFLRSPWLSLGIYWTLTFAFVLRIIYMVPLA